VSRSLFNKLSQFALYSTNLASSDVAALLLLSLPYLTSMPDMYVRVSCSPLNTSTATCTVQPPPETAQADVSILKRPPETAVRRFQNLNGRHLTASEVIFVVCS
jgi:hypothetical protein